MALPSTPYDTRLATNPTSENQEDFTLAMDLSGMSTSWWAAVDTTDATKGRAAIHESGVEVPIDWIAFDSVAETGLIRFKWLGTLSTTGTHNIRIYPPVAANASVARTATYGRDNAYDANWEGYWPDGGGVDRTGNSFNLTANGSVVAGGVTGKLGNATDYNGTTQYFSGAAPVTAMPITFLCWAKRDSGSADVAMNLANSSLDGEQLSLYFTADPENVVKIAVFGLTFGSSTTTATWEPADGWGHVAGMFSSTTSYTPFLNGVAGAEGSGGTAPFGIDTFGIGASVDSTKTYLDGQACEAQLHSVARSAAWIAYEHKQIDEAATFWGAAVWTSPTTAYDVAATFGATAGITPTAAAAAVASLTASSTLGASILTTAGAQASMAAGATADAVLAATAATSAALSAAITAGASATSSLLTNASMEVNAQAGMTPTVSVAAVGNLTLDATLGYSIIAAAAAQAGLPVAAIAGVTVSSTAVSADLVTPSGRTITVAVRSRTIIAN